MTWNQTYTPLGNVFLSALVAAIPVVVLLGLLGFFHARAHIAALAGLVSAWLVAVLVFRMPITLATAAAGYGAAYGLFPIGWIVLNAIFIYNITVQTGKFEIVKQTVANLASDRRIQALLIAFSFGAFIEGAAGFGTPVAISGAMLIGLGFSPLQAAGLALIGNTAPVAFGALGAPLIALSGVTKLPLNELSAMVGRQLPLFSLLVPFWIIWAMAGRKAMLEVWPACLTAGLSFAIAQFLMSNFHGPWLVDIVGSLVSMLSLVVLLRFWQPRTTWRFAHERSADADRAVDAGRAAARRPLGASGLVAGTRPVDMSPRTISASAAAAAQPRPSFGDAFTAWLPWILLSLFVFVWGIPGVRDWLNGISRLQYHIPYLDKTVFRVPPVVPKAQAEEAVFTLNWLSAAGTALLLSGIVSGFVLGLSPAALLRIYGQTIWRVRISLLTIACMLALGYTTRYAGSDTTMGLALASTGKLFPFFSPLLGWLGVALTGSDTSSNVLFGNLQQVSAQQLGISPVLTAAANSSGGVMGKMIDAQSIVVASVVTGGREHGGASASEILRYVFFHSIALAVLVGVLVFLQAYVFPGIVP